MAMSGCPSPSTSPTFSIMAPKYPSMSDGLPTSQRYAPVAPSKKNTIPARFQSGCVIGFGAPMARSRTPSPVTSSMTARAF